MNPIINQPNISNFKNIENTVGSYPLALKGKNVKIVRTEKFNTISNIYQNKKTERVKLENNSKKSKSFFSFEEYVTLTNSIENFLKNRKDPKKYDLRTEEVALNKQENDDPILNSIYPTRPITKPERGKDIAREYINNLKGEERYLYSGVPNQEYFAGNKGIDAQGWNKRVDVSGATGNTERKIKDEPLTLTHHYFAKGNKMGKKIAASYAAPKGVITRTFLNKEQRLQLMPDPKQEHGWRYNQYSMYDNPTIKNLEKNWKPILENQKDPQKLEELLEKNGSFPIPPAHIVYPGKSKENKDFHNLLVKDGMASISSNDFNQVLNESFSEDQDLISQAKQPVLGELLLDHAKPTNLDEVVNKIQRSLAQSHDINKTGERHQFEEGFNAEKFLMENKVIKDQVKRSSSMTGKETPVRKYSF